MFQPGSVVMAHVAGAAFGFAGEDGLARAPVPDRSFRAGGAGAGIDN